MREKKSSLRVFKLRSGEEIIAKISAKPRGKITVERPMRINYSVVADPFTGIKKSVIYFTDWLGGATELMVDIPKDFILMDLTPDPDMERLYVTQTEAQDKMGNPPPAKKEPLPELDDDMSNLPMPTEEELKKLDALMESMGLAMAEEADKKNPSDENSKPPFIPPHFPMPPSASQRGVIFTVSIPSDLVNEWVQSGIVDYLRDCFQDFMESEMADYFAPPPPKKKKKKSSANKEKSSKEQWNAPTEEQQKERDYGNRITDWSPFIKDYLPGSTGENHSEGS